MCGAQAVKNPIPRSFSPPFDDCIKFTLDGARSWAMSTLVGTFADFCPTPPAEDISRDRFPPTTTSLLVTDVRVYATQRRGSFSRRPEYEPRDPFRPQPIENL